MIDSYLFLLHFQHLRLTLHLSILVTDRFVYTDIDRHKHTHTHTHTQWETTAMERNDCFKRRKQHHSHIYTNTTARLAAIYQWKRKGGTLRSSLCLFFCLFTTLSCFLEYFCKSNCVLQADAWFFPVGFTEDGTPSPDRGDNLLCAATSALMHSPQ